MVLFRETEQSPEPEAQSAAQTGTVFITVMGAPPGARIAFDGAPVQENPFKVLQRDASFVLSVEADGYGAFKTLVSTKADKIVDAVLKPLAAVVERETTDKPSTKANQKKVRHTSASAPSSKIEDGKRGTKFGTDFE